MQRKLDGDYRQRTEDECLPGRLDEPS
jgi:hypothetical protein